MNQNKKVSDRVYKTITKHSLIKDGDSVLVAFSGGADSVCLLYILNTLKNKIGFELLAVHLNHSLRGEAADRDESFAREFCKNLGIELITYKKDVKGYAKEHGISEELAGREIRYSLFFELMRERNLTSLAVGHHNDDQAETVLMHLLRGSGIDGLSGMRHKRDNIIRPLLDITKQEILDFCEAENLCFCTDLTNFETDYNRNKVRLSLIPQMREFNPNISKNLAVTADILADDADFLEIYAEAEFKRTVHENSCNLSEFSALHTAIKRRIVIKMIEMVKNTKRDISADNVNKVLALAEAKNTGKKLKLSGGVVARIEYENLIIEKEKAEFSGFSYVLCLNEKFQIPENGIVISIEECGNGDFCFPKNSKFSVRTRQNGDRICPLGMDGSKKLKDFFIDEKISRQKRDTAVLVLCNDEIALMLYDEKLFFDRRFYKKGNFKININAEV